MMIHLSQISFYYYWRELLCKKNSKSEQGSELDTIIV